jgi:pimeloyl-ACP methyl ester carboxylesterase
MTTFVLIHGSYQGGWIWQRVAARLRGAGHTVYAPTLDGCGERKHQVRAGITTETHAAEITEMLFYEDLKDVVMVGTSSGGMVLCRAAETARERIARVVFLDALALVDGERIRDIVQRSTALPRGLTAGPSREDAETRLFADLDPATRAWALARYTLHPIGIYERCGCRASGRSHGRRR